MAKPLSLYIILVVLMVSLVVALVESCVQQVPAVVAATVTYNDIKLCNQTNISKLKYTRNISKRPEYKMKGSFSSVTYFICITENIKQ